MNENKQRNYPNSKVYYDGSHYIAIPQGSYPSGKGCKRRHTANPTPEQIDRKEQFETAYKESKSIPYKQRDNFLNERLKDAIPNDTERKGFIAENKDRMELTCLCFAESTRGDVALLIDHKNGLFITARDVSRENNGDFSWAWGHYFFDIRNAISDYDRRKNTL